MYTINQYYAEILAFTNTLSVRILDVSIAMNKAIINNGGTVSSDKTTWKYFLNLSGVKHVTNTDVKLTVIETGVVESLSVELLNAYPYTKKELMKGSNFYKELILKYPDDTVFIKGCIYPADIDKAVNSVDGTILAYNKDYVEVSEYTLISQLENFIISYLNRWFVRAYTIIDELYLPTMLGNLYVSIPNKIVNLRLEAINTNEVHSFHMEHYFRSRLNIWDNVQALRPSTKYWLYKNLDYLMKHVGKESTFQTILTKIFDDNNVGVGEYLLRIPDPVKNDDNFKIASDPYYSTSAVITSSNALNESFTIDSEEDFSLDHLINVEMTKLDDAPPETNVDIISYTIDQVKTNSRKQANDTFKTKAITLATTKLFKANGIDLTMLVINYWLHFVNNGLYNTIVDYNEPNVIVVDSAEATVDFIEPNSNQYFSVTPKVGFLLLLKQLLCLTGQSDMKLSKITYNDVVSTDKTRFQTIIGNMYQDYYSGTLFSILNDELPPAPGMLNDPLQIGSYIRGVIDYYKLVWTLDSNAESSAVNANIKQLFSGMVLENTYDLTVNGLEYTIDELLALNNVTYTVTDSFDLGLSISTIIKTFTNITIDEYYGIKERMDSYTSILNKLTSYTIQVINANTDDDTIFAYYNTLNVLRTKGGLITVLDSDLEPLEPEYVKITSVGNDFRERLESDILSYAPKFTLCYPPIIGVAEVETYASEIQAYTMIPVTTVHIMDSLLCDITKLKFKDDFIKGVTAVFLPLETLPGTLHTDTTDFNELQSAFDDANINTKTVMLKTPITGIVEIEDLVVNDIVAVITQPDVTVTLEDTLVYDIKDI